MRALLAIGLGLAVISACADRSGCSTEAPVGTTLLTSPGDSAFQAVAPDSFIARFETSRGDFFVQVVREWAPRGADRFYNLVRNGFYDGNRFFRVVDGFVVQWGVNGDPAVSQAWARQCIPDDPVIRPNTRPAITFAFGAPNTRTTQVFVNYGMNRRLMNPASRHSVRSFRECPWWTAFTKGMAMAPRLARDPIRSSW